MRRKKLNLIWKLKQKVKTFQILKELMKKIVKILQILTIKQKKVKVEIRKSQMEKVKRAHQLRKAIEKANPELKKKIEEQLKKDVLKARIQPKKK